MAGYYWDNQVKHDRPLITNCYVPGLARACGLRHFSATKERDLDMLLANIALADQECRPLSYSRHRQHKYRGTTLGRVLSGVAAIESAGLALENRTKPGHRGRQSILNATPALTEIFNKHGKRPTYEPSDPIILRSRKDGSLMPLRRTMKGRTRQIERVNEMLESISIGLEQTGALVLSNGLLIFERLEYNEFEGPHLVQQKLRLDRMGGRRVFTSDDKHHGRFYCPAQNIPGSARLLSTLNGEQVVELDFVSMHVALAYSVCGAKMDGDPYEIPGFTRKQGKLGLLTAFNATILQAAIASLTDARSGRVVFTSRNDAARLLEALKARHAPIASMLCSDAGMRLMYLDSQIMLAAVDRLIAQGIPSIPIHDSILVLAQYEGAAREALNFGWCTQNPQPSHCSIEKKRPKVPQYDCASSSSVSFGPPGGCGGWWSSVLSEARYDVVEWVG
ncbi:hypothetical protein Q2941_50410 [Bradyrhizobium sp. UFLA05-153]